MTQILGIKFSDHGPVSYFAAGAYVLRVGQHVLVETDQGQALGRVATVREPKDRANDAGDPPAAAQALPEAAASSAPEPAPFETSLGLAEWGEIETVQPGDRLNAGKPGEAHGKDRDAEHAGEAHGVGPVALFASDQAAAQPIPETADGLERILRLASDTDLETHAENRRLARRAFSFCRGCISSQHLDMKLVDVEVLHDRSKMIFFFTAPNRIDFRELIKSLVREFHTRIELRQIGVRHETQMIGAIGNCGQVCCCRRFLRRFAPVTIKMAKEQNLFLNPAKISGICGRLLCCLSYEQKGYEEFHKQCPKIGKRVQTPLGSVKVLRANFFKKSISVWVEDMGEREFTLDEWKEMLTRQPGEVPAAPAAQEAPARPQRSSGRVSTGRPSRPERTERPERGERSERPERGERSERPERGERAERPERGERAERPPRTEARQGGAPEPRPEGAPEAEGERAKPRRRRRKGGKGPKPPQQ